MAPRGVMVSAGKHRLRHRSSQRHRPASAGPARGGPIRARVRRQFDPCRSYLVLRQIEHFSVLQFPNFPNNAAYRPHRVHKCRLISAHSQARTTVPDRSWRFGSDHKSSAPSQRPECERGPAETNSTHELAAPRVRPRWDRHTTDPRKRSKVVRHREPPLSR